MLVCTHFNESSVVVENDGRIVGLVSGYRDPQNPGTLFVWQVAVDASMRGGGVASRMLKALLGRESLRDIRYVETTISPSNRASQNLFRHLARELRAGITDRPCFGRELFGGEAHEDEQLYRVGPFDLTDNA